MLENYLPSTLFVSISWGSFVVVPDIVPGRMVLLVTTLLSLVTMFDTVSNNSPDALELKCIEVSFLNGVGVGEGLILQGNIPKHVCS